jgi:uncharacterized membrane protein
MGWRVEARAARSAVAVAAVLASAFTGASFLPPLLEGAGASGGTLLRFAYAPVCHQSPGRSLEIGGAPAAVCARCTGLYVGATAGLWAGVWLVGGARRRLRPPWIAAAAAPTAADVALRWFGLPGLPNGPRLAVALPLGVAAGTLLSLGLADWCEAQSRTRRGQDARAARRVEEVDG